MPRDAQPSPSERRCAVLPPSFELMLEGGSPCPLAQAHGEVHETTTPDGRTWTWDSFTCAYPENCTDDSSGECCVSFGEVARP